ncbi:hypothetical protein CLV38_1553 [Alkalibacterium olivapovliticus]|uniref:Uncharacterized protein n=1 Tax=Alkalibacterium olivapovliticus TaxID=99907 RepID=A0A2T0VSX3_9LACT|nr:hypothetical protein CLV38_1553 [Alkalibacterium olivapovliticus]
MRNKVRWINLILMLVITTFTRIHLTFLYSPASSAILEEYFNPLVLNIIFSLSTLIIIFISILGTYIVLVVFNSLVSHEEIHYLRAKTTIYKIYINGFMLYNILYIFYLLIVNEIWESMELNISSIMLFFFLSIALYKSSNIFKKTTNRLLFSLLIFFINSLLAIYSLLTSI